MRSTDSGSSWSEIEIYSEKCQPFRIECDPNNPDIIYVGGTQVTGISVKGYMFKSIDGGSTWQKIYESLEIPFIRDICVNPANSNVVYFASYQGIYKSTDSGYTWASVHSSSFEALTVRCNGEVYAGTYSSIVCSKDGGLTWESLVSGTYLELITGNMKIDETNNVLYTCLKSGILKIGIDPVSGIENDNSPTGYSYSLSVNYPNPFNSNTTISFSIPKNEFVSIAVYNTLGKRIRILTADVYSTGSHTVIWNGKNDRGETAASGLYFYKIISGDFTQTGRMILLK